MGVVYLARDDRLGREVALKVLDIYDAPDAEQKSRFLREARAAAAIRHPNVATIYEVGETPQGLPFLAMEYCEGETLAQLVRRGPLDGDRLLSIARQIADGIAAAHRNGIVHRDIKSANIVLQGDGTVKILDFGLAKRFDASVSASATARFSSSGSSFFGTLPYISPEQANGAQADQRSDLFSVGVVLYELATGNLPFDDDSPIMLLEKIRDAEPRPFAPSDPKFPPALSDAISRLLQKDPADRFQRAEELAEALQTVEVEGRQSAPPTHRATMTRFGRTVHRRRKRSFLAAIAAGVVLLAAAGSIGFYRWKTPPPVRTPAANGPIQSIAVLPFRNISESAADAFLSVGLADALVTRLQQMPELNVRPTSAVLPYQKGNVAAKDAAQELQVDGVLEGHFLSSGDQVRVNLQLTDMRTGYGIWAATVDGRRDNLITLMDQVSSRTATALNQRLGTSQRAGRSLPTTSNPKAYEAYLQARALTGSFLQEQSDSQLRYLKTAIELDPGFAAAHAELAIALSLRQVRGFGEKNGEYQHPEWYARQAVRLDPNLPEAHLALSRALIRLPDRFRESARENLAALRLNPNEIQALHNLAAYFAGTGDSEKLSCITQLMVQIDPSSNDVRTRGYYHVNLVNPEAALELSKVALASPQTALAGHDIAAQAYLVLGDVAAAEAEQKKASSLSPTHYIGKSLAAQVAAARGDRATAERHIKSFMHDAEKNHYAALRLVLCYAKLGDHPSARRWLEHAASLGNHSWYFLLRHPWTQSLQQEAGYQRIVSRMKADMDDVRDDIVGVYELLCRRKGLST